MKENVKKKIKKLKTLVSFIGHLKLYFLRWVGESKSFYRGIFKISEGLFYLTAYFDN